MKYTVDDQQMKVDFPAAHSTDTTWFSVDSDGRLAVFDTSEHGGYPVAAERNARFDDLHHALWEDADEFNVVNYDYDPSHVFALPDFTLDVVDKFGGWMPSLSGILFELENSVEEARLLQRLRNRGYPPDAPFLRFNAPTPIWFASIDDFDGIKYVNKKIKHVGISRHRRIEKEASEMLGFYSYGVPSDDVSHAPPYEQLSTPRAPMTLARLPPSWRKWFLRVKFSTLQFHHTEQLQPFEYFSCHSWVSYWLGTDGERHDAHV